MTIEIERALIELPKESGKLGAGLLAFRPGTDDEAVLREVWTDDTYHLRTLWPEDARLRILDCGAHIGSFSALALALYPNARIWAFEPNEENRQLFAANVSDQARLFEDAIGPGPGEGTLLGSGATGRVVPGRYAREGQPDSPNVNVVSLASIIDAFAWGAGSGEIDLLKLDVEGAEYAALAACPTETLARVRRIHMEWHGFESHPWLAPGSYGKLCEQLAQTHTVQAFGRPKDGGMLYAIRY